MNLPPGWRLYDDLSDDEATAILLTYAASVPAGAKAFIAEVARLGGPAAALTYERESLVPLWTWFLATQRMPETPATEEEMREADPPWWFDFHPPLGMRLGPRLARLVTATHDYLRGLHAARTPGLDVDLGAGPERRRLSEAAAGYRSRG